DRVGCPGDFQPAPGERAVLDLTPVVIGYELAAFVVPAERWAPFALFGRSLFGPGTNEIFGQAVDRHLEARRLGALPCDLGLVVAGGESASLTNHRRFEVFGEEIKRFIRRPGRRRAASRLPVPGARQAAGIFAGEQAGAGFDEARKRRASVGGGDSERAKGR